MAVKIVTDSCSDIPQEEAKRLGITVVPAYLCFGDEVYRDGIDIDSHEFYRKLVTSPVHPSTAAPSPGDFAKVYEKAAQETDEIASIHVTSKHSAVYDAALLGKEVAERKGCRIEVIDSKGVTMWQGLVTIAAAKAAEAGYSLNQVVDRVHETISQLCALALLDTVMYVVKGGRLGKSISAISAIESLLNVKLLLTLRDGELRPAGLAHTRSKGIDRLREFMRSALHVEDLAIVYSTIPDDAQTLADYTSSLFPNIVPRIITLGPVLGVHAGPGALGIILRETKQTY
ncbi:MAG TPA: DegV family protein [Dehalococcoidia bacterium]|nr:DegV family protein [Dehalococcoidia bacterium]